MTRLAGIRPAKKLKPKVATAITAILTNTLPSVSFEIHSEAATKALEETDVRKPSISI